MQQQGPATRPHEERRNGGGRKGKRARTIGSESGGSGAAGPSAAGAAEAAGTRTEETRDGEDAAAQEILLETPQRPKRTGIGSASYVYTRQYNKRAKRQGYMLRNGQAHVLGKRAVEVGPATVERATRGRYDWQDGAGCENGEGRTRSGRKGSGGYGPGTREREGSTSNHTTNTYTHTTPHIPITAQPQQYHAGSSRTLHTTGRGEARPTGRRSRTGAPCNKGVGDVGTGPNSRTEQNRILSQPTQCEFHARQQPNPRVLHKLRKVCAKLM